MEAIAHLFSEPQKERELVPAASSKEWLLAFLHVSTPDDHSAVVKLGRTVIGAVGTRTLDLNPDHYIKDGPNKSITLKSTGPVEVILAYEERSVER